MTDKLSHTDEHQHNRNGNHTNQLSPEVVSDIWKHYLVYGQAPDYMPSPWYMHNKVRPWVRHLPSDPRCRLCYYPFEGFGGWVSKTFFGVKRSRVNPNFCSKCEMLVEKMPGGTEVEVTVLFADMRGSTGLAESMSPAEFSKLIKRFYNVATKVLFESNAVVEKLVGDAVTGFYTPGFAGPEHAKVAVNTARQILLDSGFGRASAPWVPVGIGVHTGVAYVGSVMSDSGIANMSVLGDTANIGSRLASLAGPGQIYMSQATVEASKLNTTGLQSQRLTLKGRTQPVDAWVLSV